MPGQYAQAGRLLRIATPLGPDALLLRGLDVRETIGRPYSITADVISERDSIAPTELIGKSITCTVAMPDRAERHFNGVVRGVRRTGDHGSRMSAYQLLAVPRLWDLSRTADCRIFQDLSIAAIVRKLVEEGRASPLRVGSLPEATRPYCVQWNETDLDFIQRILDEVGGGYFFEHADGSHTLVLTGANADFPTIAGDPLTVRPGPEHGGPDSLWNWHPATWQRSARSTTWDYDGLHPSSLLERNSTTVLETSIGEWELFHWPGGQTVRPDIDPAKLGIEREEAQAGPVSASGADPAVFAGGKLQVAPKLRAAPVSWLVHQVHHRARDETHLAGGSTAGYENDIVLLPADRPWRDEKRWQRPVMPGLQAAIVTGPAGQEIACDAHGRVKVHFLWDRVERSPDLSSCWCRVAQPWAGKWGGAWFLPRVGDEVLVGFLEGDPDRPIVLGSLYNEEAKQLYPPDSNRTRSWIATRSSMGGGAANANILRFEDKIGSEEVYLQAEKDLNVLVKDNRAVTVRDGDDALVVKTGNRSVKVETGNRSVSVDTGNDKLEVSLGNISIKADAGAIAIEALQSITLTVGPSKITVSPEGVTIKGLMVSAQADVMAEVSGNAMVKVTGGVIMLN